MKLCFNALLDSNSNTHYCLLKQIYTTASLTVLYLLLKEVTPNINIDWLYCFVWWVLKCVVKQWDPLLVGFLQT